MRKSSQNTDLLSQISGYVGRQIDEIKKLGWGYFSHKRKKFGYCNPFAGLLFTLTKKHYVTDGCQFLVPKDLTSIIYRSRFYYDLYEWEERQLVRSYVRSGDRVLEMGACMGVVSCVTNAILDRTSATHVVLEPSPRMIPVLKENRRINKAWFEIEQCVVTDQSEVTFYLDDEITKGTRIHDSEDGIVVRGSRLGALEEEHGEFNVLIADIQGAEVELLELEKEALQHFRLVVIEMHPGIVGETAISRCRKTLEELGFRLQETESTVEAWLK